MHMARAAALEWASALPLFGNQLGCWSRYAHCIASPKAPESERRDFVIDERQKATASTEETALA